MQNRKAASELAFNKLVAAVLAIVALIMILYVFIGPIEESDRALENVREQSSQSAEEARFSQDELDVLRGVHVRPSDVESVALVETRQGASVTTSLSPSELDQYEGKTRLELTKIMQRGESVFVTTSKTASVYDIDLKNGEDLQHTGFTTSLSLNSADGVFSKDVEIFTVIPKSITDSASNIKSQYFFEVYVDDPLIAFEIPERDVDTGSVTIEYYVEGEHLDEVDGITAYAVEVEEVEQPEFVPTTHANSEGVLIVALILLVLAIVVFVQHQHRHHH